MHGDHLDLDAEILQFQFNLPGNGFKRSGRDIVFGRLRFIQQGQWWQIPFAGRAEQGDLLFFFYPGARFQLPDNRLDAWAVAGLFLDIFCPDGLYPFTARLAGSLVILQAFAQCAYGGKERQGDSTQPVYQG